MLHLVGSDLQDQAVVTN